jgi:hypothetical protein
LSTDLAAHFTWVALRGEFNPQLTFGRGVGLTEFSENLGQTLHPEKFEVFGADGSC